MIDVPFPHDYSIRVACGHCQRPALVVYGDMIKANGHVCSGCHETTPLNSPVIVNWTMKAIEEYMKIRLAIERADGEK